MRGHHPTGLWEPLPRFVYGYAIHPLSPARRDTKLSHRTRLSTATDTEASDIANRDVVPLDVGDEVYAFEKYTPAAKEVEGIWYRGYVVRTAKRPPVVWAAPPDPSSSFAARPPPKEDQRVFIGIFPASHIYVRDDELLDAEGRLERPGDLAAPVNPALATTAASSCSMNPSPSIASSSLQPAAADHALTPNKPSIPPFYPPSMRSASPATSEALKPLPPRPSLKSGDDTASGALQPIVDEIASALREWHTLMFQYLARRDYKLFHMVKEHIEVLHLGRRQLLAQTLSTEETVNMRRECVTRLVSGNMAQGLDVIVRHPSWGGLVTVDVDGEGDPKSWVSAVRMYTMQASLAYMDVVCDQYSLSRPALAHESSQNSDSEPIPTQARSIFPEFHRERSQGTRTLGLLGSFRPSRRSSAKFVHVFLEVRAFVASPVTPGETAELFFSLFSKSKSTFLTEEFCVILNHNGVPARNPTLRIRTLFTDLARTDITEPVYLVCRIVRNGVPKSAPSSSITETLKGKIPDPRISPVSPATWDDSDPSANGKTPIEPLSQFRRPFGCAVMELSQLPLMVGADPPDALPLKEYAMSIHIPADETLFSLLHQDIIANNTKEFLKSPKAESIAVSVKIFNGDAATIVRENPSLLQDVPLTFKLGFPDVVFPDDFRNELYVKIWSGDFSTAQGGSRLSVSSFPRVGSMMNTVQVTVEVRDNVGRTVQGVISQGSGEPYMSQFNSMVYARCNQPTYGELIKLRLPSTTPPPWHLFFTFRYRNTRDKGSHRTPTDAASDRPFAFAWHPLTSDPDSFSEDKQHVLPLFKADRVATTSVDTYLSITPQMIEQGAIPAEFTRIAPQLRDTLSIRTSLCSTLYTQNRDLLRLMSWGEIKDPEALSAVLNKFTFIAEVEIVKFLRKIFDALFGILVSSDYETKEIDLLVFEALVRVLGIVQDRRFNNFQPVLDVYIKEHFDWPSASGRIIRSMHHLLVDPTSTKNAQLLRSALKVWNYIFRFISRAREIQKARDISMGGGATAEHLEAAFKRELSNHLSEVTRLMTISTPPSIIGTQTIALQNFTSILPELAKMFPTIELVTIATTFASALTNNGKGKIVIWKLVMYLQLVNGFLFDNHEARALLVENIVGWIKPHFGKFDDFTYSLSDMDTARDAARVAWLESIRLCVTIVAVMLDKLQTSLVDPATLGNRHKLRQEQINVDFILQLLPRLVDSYLEFSSPASLKAMETVRSPSTVKVQIPVVFPESYPFALLAHMSGPPKAGNTTSKTPTEPLDYFNPGLSEAAIVFLVVILTSSKKDMINFLESCLDIEGRDRFVSFVSQLFKMAISILDNDAFPKTWLNVNVLAHKVLIKMMESVGALLEANFIPSQDSDYPFDASLWKEAFLVLLKLLSSDQLVIEEFSPQKRRAVWRLAGDIRGEGSALMLSLWQALGWSDLEDGPGGYQLYLNSLVGHVVNLCLSHHDQLRNNAVQMLYTMIVTEHQHSGHFEVIQHELLTRLDSLFMSDSKGDDISRTFFITHLRSLFDNANVDEALQETVSEFLNSVDLFLELLLVVRALPEGEEFADDRVTATLRLMNFTRQIGRDEIYIKYVHQLVNMHLQSQNYVEAALTLKLHSDIHEWDLNSFVPPLEDLGLPQQSQFHRKETLCLLILDYLGRGKAWEKAIDICKELAVQHMHVTFNYARLSEILRHEATLLEHIVTEQRYYPDYYRVAFYGSFPAALRGKHFIYRGFEWEKFGAFCERMLNKHPGAQLLRAVGDPPIEIRYGDEQYIQCTAVVPEPDRTLPIFTNPDVPRTVRTYYEHSAINVFSFSRHVPRNVNGEEEVWIHKMFFTTEETFPTVLRRSEVVEIQEVEISPLENALTEVETKTKELATQNVKYTALAKTSQVVSTNPLARILNIAVDAPADSGIASYRNTFFAPDYLARFPERAEQVEKLRLALDEHVRVIDSCLKLHGHLCSPEFIPFHETLIRFFRKNFREELRRLAADDVLAEEVSVYDTSMARSMSSASTSRGYQIPPLQLGQPIMNMTVGPSSPTSMAESIAFAPNLALKQTPLQRHLAHLARHGMTGVASGLSGDTSGGGGVESDTHSVESAQPRDSLVVSGSVLNGLNPARASGASLVTSVGSGSKSRFSSRFGSLRWKKG